jgi:uncharacterized protein YciU (UPF0263 family)
MNIYQMKAINVKSVGNNKVNIQWDSDQWQYVVIGLNETDTETLNDLLQVSESDDSAVIIANSYIQRLRNNALCNPSLLSFVNSL